MSNNICNCKLKHYQPLIRLWSYLRIKLSKFVALQTYRTRADNEFHIKTVLHKVNVF